MVTWTISISNAEILKRIVISRQSNKASHSTYNETNKKNFGAARNHLFKSPLGYNYNNLYRRIKFKRANDEL